MNNHHIKYSALVIVLGITGLLLAVRLIAKSPGATPTGSPQIPPATAENTETTAVSSAVAVLSPVVQTTSSTQPRISWSTSIFRLPNFNSSMDL
jgi:hypothetical protein